MTYLRDGDPPRAEGFWLRCAARFGRAATEQPVPWLLAALVFVANATLSAIRGDWLLGALEMGTGLLAAMSAVAVASRRLPTSPDSTAVSDLLREDDGGSRP